MTETALWERQPWDTAASYDRFARFYLPQTGQRSVDAAYRQYYAERHELDVGGEAVGKKVAPGSWQRWSRGQDIKGNKIPGARSWAKRAQAFDDHVFAEARAANKAKRLETLEKGLSTTLDALKHFDSSETKLSELASMIRAVVPLLQAEYHDVPVTKHEHSGPDGGPIQTGGVTIYLPDNSRPPVDEGDDETAPMRISHDDGDAD